MTPHVIHSDKSLRDRLNQEQWQDLQSVLAECFLQAIKERTEGNRNEFETWILKNLGSSPEAKKFPAFLQAGTKWGIAIASAMIPLILPPTTPLSTAIGVGLNGGLLPAGAG